MSRQTFSDSEKVCLQELIIKYKLNSNTTIGAGNPSQKKLAWARLTKEFISIETNSKRTEAQLKKCWDNLKSRRKQALTQEKRERMRTGGGVLCVPSTPQDSIDAALLESTNIEIKYALDNINLPVSAPAVPATAPAPAAATTSAGDIISSPIQEATPAITDVEETSGRPSQSRLSNYGVSSEPIEATPAITDVEETFGRPSQSRLSNYGVSSEPIEATPAITDVEETSGRRPSGSFQSRLSNYGAPSQPIVPKNIRAHVINEEFTLRKENYQVVREREEELHKLKVAEQEWLSKAAVEKFEKARLDRQSAEELLLCSRAKRVLAEIELANARK